MAIQIHIQLAGVKLGPYTARQVREHLADGLLSLADPARIEGEAEDVWITVREALDKVPSDDEEEKPKPEPVEETKAEVPSEVAKPEAKEEQPASAAASEPIRALPLDTVEPSTPPAVTEPPASTQPKNEPTPLSMPLVVKSLARKNATQQAKPAASSGGEASPVLRVLTRKSEPESRPKPAEPLKVILSSPAAPVEPVAPVSKVPEPVPQPIKVITRKPESQEKLKVGGGIPISSSPTPTATKGAEAGNDLAALARGLAKKGKGTGPAVQPISLSPAPAAATNAPIAAKPAEPHAPLVETKPASIEPPKEERKIGVEVPEKESVSATKPEKRPAASKPTWRQMRRSLEKRYRGVPLWVYVASILAVLVLLVVLIGYVLWPYSTASSLRHALNSGDAGQLQAAVNFPSVQDSLRDQVAEQVSSASMRDLLERSIDHYVTPEGVAALAKKSAPADLGDPTQVLPIDTAASYLASIQVSLDTAKTRSQGFVSPWDFVIDLDVARLHLTPGAGWKLSRVELKSSLVAPATSGTPPSSPGTAPSPLTASMEETYLMQGQAKYQKSDWKGAIADFSQAISINPKSAVSYSNRGHARLQDKDVDGAIDDFTQAIALDPKLAIAFSSRGDARMQKKDAEGARADYTQAINLDPRQYWPYLQRANIRSAKGDFDEAIEDYTQAITCEPTLAEAYNNRGYAHQVRNDLDAAVNDFTQAIAIDAKMAGAYFNRAYVRQMQGNIDGAILDYGQALDLDPKMARAYYGRGNAEDAKNDYDGAIADYTRGLALDDTNAMAYSNRGQARQNKGDVDGALADYDKAIVLDPRLPLAYYYRGMLRMQKGDFDGAIADCGKALDLDPRQVQAFYNRGFAKLAKGNLEGAAGDFRKFCEQASRDHFADHARLFLWLIGRAQGHKADADRRLSDSLQNDWNSAPDDLTSRAANFFLDRMTEQDLLASAASSDVKKDQEQHCEAWYFAGMKRLLGGDRSTALDYFHKCVATGEKDFCEYILAGLELKLLEPTAKN